MITKIIKQLDDRWNIWESIDHETEEKKAPVSVPSSTDDSEISSSTTNTSPMKNKNPIGFVSYNPLLKNITEHLVEEGDAEEDESAEDANTFEIDKDLNKVRTLNISFLIPRSFFTGSRSFDFILTCCSFS